MLKLFKVTYMDDGDTDSYLTVGKSEDAVTDRERGKLEEELSCFMWFMVMEIKEVDGYEIALIGKVD